MKRTASLLLALALLACCLPALAEGAALPSDEEDFIPYEVRQFFADPALNGYTVRPGASQYFENTAGGTFFFTVVQKDGYNALYGFEEKNGRFQYWLKTDGAIPQGRGFFSLSRLSGDLYLLTDDPLHLDPDSLSILFTAADDEEQAECSLVFSPKPGGQWILQAASFHKCWDEAVISDNGIQYYLNEGVGRKFVSGVAERNLRYFSWDAFPKSIRDAEAALSNPPAIPTGELTAQRIKFEGGKKYPVYTGPGTQYDRANNGKAAVSTNDWIQVFGSENGYILIQYDITSTQMRFGWIEMSALPKGAAVSALRFAYDDAAVTAGGSLTDDPLYSRAAIRSVNAGQQVKWLAAMGEWVYVEIADQGKPIRGFFPAQSVLRAGAWTAYEGAYAGNGYEARAALRVREEITGDRTLDVTVRVAAPAAWSQSGADKIVRYQFYANQTLLAELPGGADGCTFEAHLSLPAAASIVGLCPVYESGGPKAAEMIAVPLATAASAPTAGRAVVNNPDPGDRLFLRARPNGAGDALGKYYNGTEVTIVNGGEEYDGYTRVRIAGVEGYMKTEYLAFGDAANRVASAQPTVTVNNQGGTGLNLRQKPHKEGALIRLIPNGEQATVMGITEDGWLHVSYNGQTGYLLGTGVTPRLAYNKGGAARKARITAACSVYASPESLPYDAGDARSNIVSAAYAGSTVTVYQEKNGFAQIGKSPDRWVPAQAIEYLE